MSGSQAASNIGAGQGPGQPLYLAPAPGPASNATLNGPVTSVGTALPGTAGGGYLHVTVNGVDLRIPLLTPAQAGG